MRDLFQQKSFLQSIFNAIPILTFVLDKDVKVRAVNQAAKKFLNYKEEFNSFKSCGETLGCRHAADHPLG
ncbi:MAG: PAS domain-containing protein, partial [Peptococcaceae bacterium]|nr:PAS domain-containing protein [Peptococcaceae bacterium]